MNYFLSKYSVFSTFIIFLMASFSTSASFPVTLATKKTTIHIGIYAPFSNESAFIGRNMLGALEIARDHLKSSKITYEFYTLDTLPDTANAEKTLQKFIDIHHINVLLTEGSNSGLVAAPLAKKNNMIHFCLTSDSVLADGTNNFLAQGLNHQKSAALTKTSKPEFVAQFQQEYWSKPITQAGYTYDLFHILHQSATLAMKNSSDFSSQAVATQLLALESGAGVMGVFNLDKKGIFYKKQVVTA